MLSRYVKIYPCRDRPGSHLLYSSKKGSVVRASADLLAAIKSETLSAGDRETLTRLAILNDDPAVERASMADVVSRANQRCNKFKAIVVLNLDCNLACPYCFEEPFRSGRHMTSVTADLLVETIINEQILRGRTVELDFYGGEPLLSLPLLRVIAATLQSAARDRENQFSFGMVTNGTLLTRPLVEELVPFGFTGARITLDGPRDIHDRQRPFISGRGSFDAIIANIKATWDLLDLQVGGNFTQATYREIPRMLDFLLAEGITPEKLGLIQFAPILPKSGKKADRNVCAGCITGNEPWLAEAALFLREETMKRGFTTFKPTMAACKVEFTNDFVVNYDGLLYKCPAFMGWPELSIGTLADGVGDHSVSHNLELWKTDECLECAYLPLCFGGCRLLPLLNHGSIDRVDCRKEFYDTVLERFILQDLRYRPSASVFAG